MPRRKEQPLPFVSGWDDDNQGVEEDANVPAILQAAERGDLNEVRELVTAEPLCVSARDKDGYTALHRASYSDFGDVARFLLGVGADIEAGTADNWRPLHSASRWGNAHCVNLLLEHGADVNAKSAGSQTPLHLAAAHGYTGHTLQLLLMHPAIEPNVLNSSNETASDIARRSGKLHYLFEMTEPCLNYI